jgi:hypothetical protein
VIKSEAKINILNSPDDRYTILPFNFINPFDTSFFFINSSILTRNERISLTQMLNNLTEVKLIYRASRDGFAVSSFHSKCDDYLNTVTIIKTTSNSVFGGFTSATWTSDGYWTFDSNAFIFWYIKLLNLVFR